MDSDQIAKFLSKTYLANMHNGEYAFISLDFSYHPQWNEEEWFEGPKALEGLLNLGVKSWNNMYNTTEFKNNLKGIISFMGHDLVKENLTVKIQIFKKIA